ncbi:hypothetical protein LCGC14_2385380 [marine sediment metagenome]|uniref:Uncharacterized protein n=1 Tax=marine sediment metagenome TaxID=412755 RepID=A0A0F9BZU4_9ZZZZ
MTKERRQVAPYRKAPIHIGDFTDEQWCLIGIIARMQKLTREQLIRKACFEYIDRHKVDAKDMLEKITRILK